MSLSPENRALVDKDPLLGILLWTLEGGREFIGQPTDAPHLSLALNRLLDAARSHESERVKRLVEAARQLANAAHDYSRKAGISDLSEDIGDVYAALSAIPGEAVLAGEGNSSAGFQVSDNAS